MMIAVRREDDIARVRSDLARRALEVLSVQREWWPFGRRWRVAVKSQAALPIDEVQMEEFLNTVDGALAQYDATVMLWVPLR